VLKPVSALFHRRFIGKDTVTITLAASSDIPTIVAEVRAAAGTLIQQILIGEGDRGSDQIEVLFSSGLNAEMLHSLIDRVGDREDVTPYA
jgi:hypothetical protein